MGNFFSNIIYTSKPKKSGASLNILTFDCPQEQIVSWGNLRHYFFLFNDGQNKQWNATPCDLPVNITKVSDTSLAASPLLNVDYDLVLYQKTIFAGVAIQYSKKLGIPILRTENAINSMGENPTYADMTVYSDIAVAQSWLPPGNINNYLIDSVIKTGNLKDYQLAWDKILLEVASMKSGVLYE